MAFYNSIQEQIKSGDGITLTVDDNSGSVIISAVGGGGAVPISGTTDRISVEGSVSQTVDIASTYIGQTTIHTLGNISIGTWNAGDVTANNVTATNLNITANNNVESCNNQILHFE